MARRGEQKDIERLAQDALVWVVQQGWVSQQEFLEYMAERGVDSLTAFKVLRFLDRQAYITRREHEGIAGFEATPHRPRVAGRQYGGWVSYHFVCRFLTPCLGGLSEPGEETFKRHLHYDGAVIIPRANIIAMLKRAADLMELGETPKVALKRVRAQPVVLRVETRVAVRRPVRPDRVAVEPIQHEAVPEGTPFDLLLGFPASHFNEGQVVELVELAGMQVGLSPAAGANGAWGLFIVEEVKPLTVAARQED